MSESVVVDNGFVRNTPVKEIGKCVKSFHTERYNPYPVEARKRSTKLLYDDDAFDSLLGKSKRKFKTIKVTPKILEGFYKTPVKEKFIHLGNIELQSTLDPLTTPVKILVKSITPIKVSGKKNLVKIKKFKAKESPLKHELFTEHVDSDIEESLEENNGLQDSLQDISIKTKVKNASKKIQNPEILESRKQDFTEKITQENVILENIALKDSEISTNLERLENLKDLENSENVECELKKSLSKIEENQTSGLESVNPVKEESLCKTLELENIENASQELNSCIQNVKECGSWWDIYGEESNSPEYKSRTVVYDSEVDVF